MKNTHGFDLGPCEGGNFLMATAYLARWSGPVNENDDRYNATSGDSPPGLSSVMHTQNVTFLPLRSGSMDNDLIKEYIHDDGGLYACLIINASCFRPDATTYYLPDDPYYTNGTAQNGHAILLVGWNDTYDKSNFVVTPPDDGAFIAKNSWGTGIGENGYFYISYYDSSLKDFAHFSAESVDKYDGIYQHDPLGCCRAIGAPGRKTIYAANVFTATEKEDLAAIGFYTLEPQVAYTYEVFAGLDAPPVNTSGPVATGGGTLALPGYHTIPLATQVPLASGQTFSVVLNITSPLEDAILAVEGPIGYPYSDNAVAGAGESYVSLDGTSWGDLTGSFVNTNLCIRAYSALNLPPLEANFTAVPTSGTAPLTVQFTDASTGAITSRQWTFGDGNTSDDWSPSYTYQHAGVYTVNLTVTGSGGDDTASAVITVEEPAPELKANFTAFPTSGTAPLTVSFTDTSSGSPTSWLWDFDDGNTSTVQNPSHIYVEPGTYFVNLTVSNGTTQSWFKLEEYIDVDAAPLDANFTASPTTGTAPLAVQFTDTSTGIYDTCVWTFGDGNSSGEQNPVYIYTVPGLYTVNLTISSGMQTDTETKEQYINITAAPPVLSANFMAVPQNGTAPLTVQFTDTSTGAPTSWLWDFKDGNFSTEQHPTHTYISSGLYNVNLTVSDGKTSSSYETMEYIEVYEPQLEASFTASPTTGTAPLTVQFTDASTGTPTSWQWTFGDGNTSDDRSPSYTYQHAGTYTVNLTVTGSGGDDTTSTVITVNEPVPDLKASFTASPTSGLAPLTVQFTDASTGAITSRQWTFGDGNTSDDWSPSYTYQHAGVYTVNLTVTGSGGDDKASTVITVEEPVPDLKANFTASPTSGTAPLTVQFTDASTGTPTSWRWTFGDGNTSDDRSPSYTYQHAGTYTVSLMVSDGGTDDTITRTDLITVEEPVPDLKANFTASPTSGTAPLTVQFTDASTGTPTSWRWTFGDGNTSDDRSPSYTYQHAGVYTVNLTVSNRGMDDRITRTDLITVNEPKTTPTRSSGSSSDGGRSLLSAGVFERLKKGESGYVSLSGSVITRIGITANSSLSDVLVTVGRGSPPSSAGAPGDTIYAYLEILLYHATNSDLNGAEIIFSVPLAWLEEHGAGVEDVVLYRYHNNTWVPLPTEYIEEKDGKAYFRAETEGFSLFAVVIEAPGTTVVMTPVAPVPTDTTLPDSEDPGSTPTQSEEPESTPTQTPLPAALSLLAAGTALLLRGRRG
ncbi:PGF-pre-PGF domain-containing protein [Methanofollis sp. W23]|nr:PGF-pre-PGF domain-containing protein [Methanofollis sp. W23]